MILDTKSNDVFGFSHTSAKPPGETRNQLKMLPSDQECVLSAPWGSWPMAQLPRAICTFGKLNTKWDRRPWVRSRTEDMQGIRGGKSGRGDCEVGSEGTSALIRGTGLRHT